MRKLLIVTLLLLSLSACKKSIHEPIVSINDEITNYFLDIELDEQSDTLLVHGKIQYYNTSSEKDELYLKVYPNAYNISERNHNVLFNYIKINDKTATYNIRGEDNTSIYIELDETLLLEETIIIEFDYLFSYWDIGRLIAVDDCFTTMFFYPFVAQFDDEGWNLDPFNFYGETYYNDIGDYYVNIDVPSVFLLGSSGKTISTIENQGRTIYEIELINGRDFSFSTSINYIEYRQEINNIDVKILSLNELSEAEKTLAFDTIENSFELYTDIIGEYNYDYFTLELGHIYGMESSGIIYCSQDLSEITIIHEIVHQWFYSMIGNDQGDEAWLDEGLTTFATGLYFLNYTGETADFDGYVEWYNPMSSRVTDRMLENLGYSTLRNINEFEFGYGILVYYHGATLLYYYTREFLDDDYEIIYDVFREYYAEYNGKIATVDSFLNLLEEETGIDGTKEFFMMHLTEFQDYENRP